MGVFGLMCDIYTWLPAVSTRSVLDSPQRSMIDKRKSLYDHRLIVGMKWARSCNDTRASRLELQPVNDQEEELSEVYLWILRLL